MRKIYITIFALFFVSLTYSQTITVPEIVENAFKARYPEKEAKKIEWTVDDKEWYRVTFLAYGAKNYIIYHPDGYLLENGEEIKFNDLLELVADSFLKKYSKSDVLKVFKIYSAAAPERNRIVINGSNGAEVNLYYNHQGTLYLKN